MLRHLAWFNESSVTPDASGQLTSPDEQVQRRCLIPARELEALGIACSVFGNLHDADPAHVARHLQKLQTDIVIVSNIQGTNLFNQARMAKHLGCYVVADFGAQDIDEAVLSKYSTIADCLITANQKTADQIDDHHVHVIVIPDCENNAMSEAIVEQWLTCFKAIKAQPPLCANSNQPRVENA
jgi:hypothetical protein